MLRFDWRRIIWQKLKAGPSVLEKKKFDLVLDTLTNGMGQFKKEKARVARSKEGGDDRATNIRVKGENFYRDAKKLRYINMLKGGKAIRNSAGKIVKAADFQSTEVKTARVAPNRKWFGK